MSPTSFQTAPPRDIKLSAFQQMDGGGFEPPKQFAADLQSVPFGHSGTHPNRPISRNEHYYIMFFQKTVIVSNNYHLYRAGMIADELGIVWGGKPAETAAWLFPTYYVRELYAILAEWILY